MKRMLGAVVACVLVAVLVGELFGLAWSAAFLSLPVWAGYAFWPLSSLATLAGVAVGTFIARGRFLVAALALWLLGTGLALTFGFRLQLAAVPMSLVDYLALNVPSISCTLVASACGLALGRAAYARWSPAGRAPNKSSKPTPLRGAA